MRCLSNPVNHIFRGVPREFGVKAYKAGILSPMWPVEYGGTPPPGGASLSRTLSPACHLCMVSLVCISDAPPPPLLSRL